MADQKEWSQSQKSFLNQVLSILGTGPNYLTVAALPIGLLVNFRRRKLEWKRLQSNDENFDKKDAVEEAVPFEFFQ